jgi:5-methyltetrahydrofolate--homocysteine methyltransferase
MTTKRSQLLQDLNISIMKGDTEETAHLIEQGLKNNLSSEEIMDNVLIPVSKRIAEKFRGSDFYIPDVLFAVRPIKTGLAVIKDLSTHPVKHPSKVVVATVAGDIHDIGKNLVAIFLQVNGYPVIDLGVDVPAEQIIQAVEEHQPAVIALSSLLTTTMGEMAKVIEILEKNRLRRSVKVIVGGGPVSDNFAEFIGADGYSPHAPDIIDLVNKLL